MTMTNMLRLVLADKKMRNQYLNRLTEEGVIRGKINGKRVEIQKFIRMQKTIAMTVYHDNY